MSHECKNRSGNRKFAGHLHGGRLFFSKSERRARYRSIMPGKSLPQFVAPMQASSAKKPFDSPDWIFENKLDGYRAIAVIDSTGKARIWSRNRLPLEQKFPTVREAAEELNLRSTISRW
jgi:ATP-dependent DNA ligase